MEKLSLPYVFLSLVVMIFPNILGIEMCEVIGSPQIIFSDDFDDGDVSDWQITTQGGGSFAFSGTKYVSSPFSFYMDSMGNSQAMAVSPVYDVNLSENYNVSFSFLIPDTNNHWFEVFNNHQIYLVIDQDDELKCYDGSTSYLIDELNTNQWYDIEIKAYPTFDNYDVYIDSQFKRTCDMWTHTGFEDKFRIGDRENGSNDYGKAYWDDFVITQPVDTDGDGVDDPNDNCPYVSNPQQEDRNSDGWGDVCECEAANLDGLELIDFLDFSTFAADWLVNGTALAGDIDSDQFVDFNDLEILAYHWLSDCNDNN